MPLAFHQLVSTAILPIGCQGGGVEGGGSGLEDHEEPTQQGNTKQARNDNKKRKVWPGGNRNRPPPASFHTSTLILPPAHKQARFASYLQLVHFPPRKKHLLVELQLKSSPSRV